MRKYLLVLVICLSLVFLCVLEVGAVALEISTVSLPTEEKLDFIDKINLSLLNNENKKSSIKCFDVNQNGDIAIGIGAQNNCNIYVYDSNGCFQYGYAFSSNGDYGIEYQGEDVGIFFTRSNVIAIYDASGTCKDVRKVISSNQSHIYAKEILNRTSKTINGIEFVLERDIDIGDSYSRLLATPKSGEQTVIYDYSIGHLIMQIGLISMIICFFTFVVWGIYQKQKTDR